MSSTRNTLLASLFTALLIVGSYIRIPVPPIPFTLQTLFLILGSLMIRKWMFLSIFAYFLLGLLGVPVFAQGGGGIAYFLGPTGGFLIGFFPATICIVSFSGLHFQYIRNFLVSLIAIVLLYVSGVLWLLLLQPKMNTLLPWFLLLLPPGDIIKTIIAVLLFYKIGPLIYKR